jgi:hypothetical protein
MTIQFRTAKREAVGLLIGLVGASGSGKTYTAMRLATGISGGKPFAVIDTESRRALHYADTFLFDHAELHAPFTPDAYAEAIKAADAAGYPVIVVDSMSHSWAGDGGVLDWQEAEFERMGSKDSMKMLSWAKPKRSHKKMVQTLLQVKAHLILCFRAEPKVEMVRIDGKTVIQEKHSLTGLHGYIPVCDKTLPFELTTSLMFTPDKPGIPQPIKLQDQHKALFPLDKVVDESSGERIAVWAKGGTAPSAPAQHTDGAIDFISVDQGVYLDDLLKGQAPLKAELIHKYGALGKIPAGHYPKVKEVILAKLEEA